MDSPPPLPISIHERTPFMDYSPPVSPRTSLESTPPLLMQPITIDNYLHNVTTEHIQQLVNENKSQILKILESQNSGKASECAESQEKLRSNLMYLAVIVDSQQQEAYHRQQLGMSNSCGESSGHGDDQGRDGSSSGHGGDGGENLYLKSSEDEN
ncbi:hypothetical protein P3S68_015911 [Capsicum galapagoense]